MAKKIAIVSAAIYALIVAALCATDSKSVTLRVTRDFGAPPLIERQVRFSAGSVMELMQSCAAVETSYGGAFVNAINGARADRVNGSDRAWLYYVNGVLAGVGALHYSPREGDVIWWDLHAWERYPVQALIGAYPLPFTSPRAPSDPPPRIVCSVSLREKAVELRRFLDAKGATGISVSGLSTHSIPSDGHIIVMGTGEEIGPLSSYGSPFIRFDTAGLHILDHCKTPVVSLPRAGAIVAARQISPRPRAIWLVTGTDRPSALRAADLLLREPHRIRGLAGAVVAGDRVYPVPPI